MERIVKFVAPRNTWDFVCKLLLFVLLCGVMNHIRDAVTFGLAGAHTFARNVFDASWIALPMCAMAMFLIRHLNNLQERLYIQATTDPLTKLPNRRWFFEHCGNQLEAGTTFVLLDVDHFKTVNDTYGHDTGDKSLKVIAAHIKNSVPDGVLYARLGGEEFGVLFPEIGPHVLVNVGLICTGTTQTVPDAQVINLTLSAGIYEARNNTNIKTVFSLADAAMYQAKDAGRSRYVMADTNSGGKRLC